jgi:hypothetical protein
VNTRTPLGRELAAAIQAGDRTRVRDLIVAAPEKERRAAAGARAPFSFRAPSGAKEGAAALAWIGTTTAKELATWAIFLEQVELDDLIADVLGARGRRFFDTLARALRGDDLSLWPLLRLAVRRGLAERPDTEAWARGLVATIGGPQRHGDPGSVYRGLLEDPELLEDDVWQIFEVDCGTELSNAAVWVPRTGDGAMPRWDRADNRWTSGLLRLAAEGQLDRDRLLDASLEALTRDFRPSMVSWYARFHEALEPSDDERAARVDRYLALLTSPVPAVVSAGLIALRAIEEAVPGDALAAAAASALTLPQKKTATDVLRLLGRAAERDPDTRAALLETIAQAPRSSSGTPTRRLAARSSVSPRRCRQRSGPASTSSSESRTSLGSTSGRSRSSLTPTGPSRSASRRTTHSAARPRSHRSTRSTS